MKRWLPITVLLFCLTLSRGARAGGASPEAAPAAHHPGPVLDATLTVGEIVISYPHGLESQARQVAEVCKAVLVPRREKFLAMERGFADGKRTARVLTQMLGCPESEQTATTLIAGTGELAAFVEPMFTDVRLYREADLKASGGVSGGAISLIYLPAEDKFQFQIGYHATGPEGQGPTPPAERSFLPVVVKADGTFRAENGLAAFVAEMLDFLATETPSRMYFAAIRLGASLLLAQQCGREPFTQWFSEGAAQWATPRVVAEIAPGYAEQCREMLLPDAPSPQARARVNLLAWPFGEDPRPRDARDEESAYCAYELAERLLRDRPAGTLATIMDKLKSQKPLDTEAILRTLDATLGGDSRSLLLEYVPEAVRTGLKEGRPAKLREEGYQALRDGECSKAVKLLSDALEMTPSDTDMRINLAIAMRRSGIPKQGSERQIRLAAALAQAQASRDLAVQGKADDETRYVLGRAEQLRGRTQEAKEIFSRLPKDHEDAQDALKELETAEAAEKALGPEPSGTAPPAAQPAPAPQAGPAQTGGPALSVPAPVVEISVEGNEHVPTEKILAAITSTKGGPYCEEQVALDREAILNLGWFQTVAVSREDVENGARVGIRVSENPVIREIRFEGVSVIAPEDLLKVTETKPGDVYNVQTLARDAKAIEHLYASKGYILAAVLGTAGLTGEGVLTIGVMEGVIEAIRITGNTYTKTDVIQRYMCTWPGDVYNDKKAVQDVARLSATGWFESVARSAEVGSARGKVVLVMTVVEKKRTE